MELTAGEVFVRPIDTARILFTVWRRERFPPVAPEVHQAATKLVGLP